MLTYINPSTFWKEAAYELNGEFEITRQVINGGRRADQFNLKIFIEKSGIKSIVHSDFSQSSGKFEEYGLDRLRVEVKIISHDEFYFYYWKKEFFDKLFCGHKTGFSDFDDLICFKSNKINEVIKLLSNEEYRKALMDFASVFNINWENGDLNIKLQTVVEALNKEMILKQVKKYLFLVDGFVSSKLILPNKFGV